MGRNRKGTFGQKKMSTSSHQRTADSAQTPGCARPRLRSAMQGAQRGYAAPLPWLGPRTGQRGGLLAPLTTHPPPSLIFSDFPIFPLLFIFFLFHYHSLFPSSPVSIPPLFLSFVFQPFFPAFSLPRQQKSPTEF